MVPRLALTTGSVGWMTRKSVSGKVERWRASDKRDDSKLLEMTRSNDVYPQLCSETKKSNLRHILRGNCCRWRGSTMFILCIEKIKKSNQISDTKRKLNWRWQGPTALRQILRGLLQCLSSRDTTGDSFDRSYGSNLAMWINWYLADTFWEHCCNDCGPEGHLVDRMAWTRWIN